MRLLATVALGGLSSFSPAAPPLLLCRTIHSAPSSSLGATVLGCGRVAPSRRVFARCTPARAALADDDASAFDGSSSHHGILSVNEALDFSLPYRVLAFYAIAPIEAPDEAVERHRAFLAARDMVGRVYLCADGLNAQVSGTADACEEYRQFAAAEFPSERLVFKEDPLEDLAFPKLRVKHKGLVPAPKSGEAVDLANRGEDVPPEKWAAMLGAGDGDAPVVLDVRNNYEWDVGRFDGAARPALDHFTDFDPETFGLPSDEAAKKETPVMMYCTGGIR